MKFEKQKKKKMNTIDFFNKNDILWSIFIFKHIEAHLNITYLNNFISLNTKEDQIV